MSDQTPIIAHGPINIVLTIENGKVTHARPVQDDEITTSLETFLWMAERAGYTVTPPAGGKDNGLDSDTNSWVGTPAGGQYTPPVQSQADSPLPYARLRKLEPEG